jgi:predicted nucleic acid-binding Zn ribbon protein
MKSGRSRKTNLVPISSVLRDSQKRTQQVFAISSLRKQWSSIVGEMLANQTRPKKIDRNVLWVTVQNGALNYELSLMKPAILEKIQEITGTKFKDVRFIHESLLASETIGHEPSRQKFVRAEAKEDESLDKILEHVRNLSRDLQKKN